MIKLLKTQMKETMMARGLIKTRQESTCSEPFKRGKGRGMGEEERCSPVPRSIPPLPRVKGRGKQGGGRGEGGGGEGGKEGKDRKIICSLFQCCSNKN